MRKEQLLKASEIAFALQAQAELLGLTVSRNDEPIMHDLKVQDMPFQIDVMFGTWALQVTTNKAGAAGYQYEVRMWAPRAELPVQIAAKAKHAMVLVSHEGLGAEASVVGHLCGRMVERLVINRLHERA